jgi:aminoglycoside phosphotransferase (APT) family kinase protein
MPVAGQLEPDEVKSALEPWIAKQLPDARDVRILDVVIPQSTGFSNETFLVDAAWADDDGDHDVELVLRSQSSSNVLFPEADLVTHQFRTMQLLGEHSDVPVARMRWAESDPSVLGRAFFVMDRLHGQVAGDSPPYTVAGFVMEMDPETRRRWHTNAVEAMTRVHAVDWRSVGFDYLDQRHHGTLGPEQRHNYFDHYRQWTTRGEPHPVVDLAWPWLDANWPDDGEFVELCWGDARPANEMFQGTEVVGVFDWEMVSLGNSESDLGWWIFLQRFHTDGTGVPLPEGMLDREEIIAEWERLRGRPARHVDFYERLGGFQFTLVMIKLAESMGLPDMAVNNPVAHLTRQLIEAS